MGIIGTSISLAQDHSSFPGNIPGKEFHFQSINNSNVFLFREESILNAKKEENMKARFLTVLNSYAKLPQEKRNQYLSLSFNEVVIQKILAGNPFPKMGKGL